MVADHPVVMVVGPRATGKTTSAQRLARSVVQLADNRQRTAFASDIEYGLTSKSEPVLIDEWQEVPESLGHVKVLVDAEPRTRTVHHYGFCARRRRRSDMAWDRAGHTPRNVRPHRTRN